MCFGNRSESFQTNSRPSGASSCLPHGRTLQDSNRDGLGQDADLGLGVIADELVDGREQEVRKNKRDSPEADPGNIARNIASFALRWLTVAAQ